MGFPWLLTLALLQGAPRPQEGPLGPTTVRAAGPDAGALEELERLRARDARLSFNADSSRRARAVLEANIDEVETRSVALLAVGCGRREVDLETVSAALEGGTLPVRRAAVLALGALGAPGVPALEGVLAGDTAGLEECLCLALALAAEAGAPSARARLEALAAGEGGLARRAGMALATLAGEAHADLFDTLGFYYELRWRAARAYGFVDGMRGPRAYAAELFRDGEFLDRVVLSAATELSSHELQAHLSEILLGPERPGALRVAVQVDPEGLARLLETGDWQPSPEAWRAILAEIDEKRLEGRTQKLLRAAYRVDPQLEFHAGMLLYRAGADVPFSWVRERLEGGTREERAALMEACGERGEKQRLTELAQILEKSDELGIAGEARVALVRLGHPPAEVSLREALSAPPSAARDRTVWALARTLHDPKLRSFAAIALKHDDLPQAQRFALVVGLAVGGATVDLGEVRTALAEARVHGTRMTCVRALAADPIPQNIEAMAAVFPVESDPDLDVELALVLLRARHPSVQGLLRSALWSDSWNRSVLAGGLIVQQSGTRALLDELELAPRSASERDVRRVGFALGEWGGLGMVEELARARTEADPALQGALLGALSARAGEEVIPRRRPPVKFDLQSLGGPAAAGAGRGGGGPAKGKGKGKGGKRRKL